MDIVVIETGNGGDLVRTTSGLATTEGWGNMPYLAMFGGNVEASTRPRKYGEEGKDWWGNNLLFPQDLTIQFNSETERVLRQVALTSSGREKIQQAVEKDLEFMKAFSELKITVSIVSDDHVRIDIYVKIPFGGSYKYTILWDGTKQEIGDYRFDDYSDDYFVG